MNSGGIDEGFFEWLYGLAVDLATSAINPFKPPPWDKK